MPISSPFFIKQKTFKILCHKPFMITTFTFSTSNSTIYVFSNIGLFQNLRYLFFITIC